MFMLRIRFDTFCTVPVIASSAPIRRAKRISQPPQPCRLLACASLAIGVISTSEKRPESPSSCRKRSLRRASRSCSSGRAPLTAPSRLVSINSKSKTATDCATVGPQLTNNKAHNVTRYDGMIMVVYLAEVLALACSFHLRHEYHCHQSNRSSHHRRRQHQRLRPAAVGSLLQILINRIRNENANTALPVTVHGRACPCRSGGSGALIPSPGRSA